MLELWTVIDQIAMNYQAVAVTKTEILTNTKISMESPSPRFTPERQEFNYGGRIDWQNPQAPAFTYPGTSVEFKFIGTQLQIQLAEDDWGAENYVDVYLDDNPQPITIKLKKNDNQPILYQIAQGLEPKAHKVKIYKRNDYSAGEFSFHGIVTDGKLLAAEPDSERTIEVYGDSITSGVAVEYGQTGVSDPEGDNNHLSNAYYSYASILARDYQAEVSLVSQSGISLINGFGYWHNGTGAEATYDKVKPLVDAPAWDFSNYNPDLVILAYGQNDSSSINLGQDLSSQEWKERYQKLLANLRKKYPHAYFIGMFPAMYHDRQWDRLLQEAIAEYRDQYHDDRIFPLILPQVTPGHPRIAEQQVMAEQLTELIEGKLTDHGFNW
jgi:lysophospholipase L1-like esterase